MKKILSILFLAVSLNSFSQLPILIGVGGNNTGVTALTLKDSILNVKNLLITDYASQKRLADSMAFIKQYGNSNYVLVQRFLDSITAVRSAIGTGGSGSNQEFPLWAANTPYLSGDAVNFQINSTTLTVYRISAGTSAATLTNVELQQWFYISQTEIPRSYPVNTLLISGYEITIDGVLYKKISTGITTTDLTTDLSLWNRLSGTALKGYASSYEYQTGELIDVFIGASRCTFRRNTLGTSPTTAFATDIANFSLISQVNKPTAYPASTTLPINFEMVVNDTLFKRNDNTLSNATFDATERAKWSIVMAKGGSSVLNFQKFAIQTTAPTATNDTASLYFRQIAERRELAYIGKFNDVSVMQRSFNNRYNSYIFSNGTNGFNTTGYGSITTSGTIGAVTLSAGSYRNHSVRTSLASAATAGAITFIRSSSLEIYGGENVVGLGDLGGYYVDAEFGLNAFSATSNFFIGIHNSGSNPSNLDATASTTLGKIGIAFTVGTGNMKLVHNNAGSAPTVIDLTHCPINATDYYRLVIYNPANSTSTYVSIVNLQTNVTQNFTITTNKPTNATFLSRCAYLSNDADAAINTFVLTRFNLEAR